MSRRTTSSKTATDSAISSPSTKPPTSSSLLPPRPGPLSTVRTLQLADYITLLNGFSGLMSIQSSLRYCISFPCTTATAGSATAGSPHYLWFALVWIPLGLFFDFMDGRVARWRGKGAGSALGQELDSLADLISFGVAPAACAFAMGMRSGVDGVVLAFFVLCGLLRLARFNVSVGDVPKDAKGKSMYFEGLPIPSSLGIVGGMASLLFLGLVGEERLPLGVLGEGEVWEFHAVGFVFVVWGCLMTSRRLRVPKP